MTWIKTIPYEKAKGRLKKNYDRIVGPNGNVDNIMLAHSLRPHTLEGHMTLYKYVLHHPGNSFDKWFLELLGTYVSYLNECSYCFEHHYAGMARIIGDDEKSNSLAEAIHQGKLAHAEHLSEKERALVGYAYKLTLHPTDITIADIDMLQHHGADDGEILEINQVVAYFAYANRTVMGLGINTSGDIIGLSPNDNDDPDNWSHQ